MAVQESLFTNEEIATMAKGNATAMALGVLAVLKHQGASAEEFFTAFGRFIAPAWEGLRDQGALAMARVMAGSGLSFGATVESLRGDERQAQLVTTGWPSAELLGLFKLVPEDIAPLWNQIRPVADLLGLDYHVEQEGDHLTFTVTQR
jgi:hypothetical protein